MIQIAHRGNTEGRDLVMENHPNHILTALAKGYDAEIDIWFEENKWWLGHDAPTFLVPKSFIEQPGIWCHAKNDDALRELHYTKAHYFWHENDRFTLTSLGYIWTCNLGMQGSRVVHMYPEGRPVPPRVIGPLMAICADKLVPL